MILPKKVHMPAETHSPGGETIAPRIEYGANTERSRKGPLESPLASRRLFRVCSVFHPWHASALPAGDSSAIPLMPWLKWWSSIVRSNADKPRRSPGGGARRGCGGSCWAWEPEVRWGIEVRLAASVVAAQAAGGVLNAVEEELAASRLVAPGEWLASSRTPDPCRRV